MMRQLRFISIILFMLPLSCETAKKGDRSGQSDKFKVKLVKLKKYSGVYEYTAVMKTGDTAFLISGNKLEYPLHPSKQIKLKLAALRRYRVGQMEKLGVFVIFGNDTLWKGCNMKDAPTFYMIKEHKPQLKYRFEEVRNK